MKMVDEKNVTHIVPLGFHSKQIYRPIKEYGGNKLILLVSKASTKKEADKIEDTIKQAKEIGKMLDINLEIIEFERNYNMDERYEKLSRIFKREKSIVLNLTGGPKFDSLLLYSLGLKYTEKVKAIIYVRDDINEVITLPKIVFGTNITPFEREILLTIKKNKGINAKDLSKKLDKPFSQILRYLRRLEEKNLIKTIKDGQARLVYLKAPLL